MRSFFSHFSVSEPISKGMIISLLLLWKRDHHLRIGSWVRRWMHRVVRFSAHARPYVRAWHSILRKMGDYPCESDGDKIDARRCDKISSLFLDWKRGNYKSRKIVALDFFFYIRFFCCFVERTWSNKWIYSNFPLLSQSKKRGAKSQNFVLPLRRFFFPASKFHLFFASELSKKEREGGSKNVMVHNFRGKSRVGSTLFRISHLNHRLFPLMWVGRFARSPSNLHER